MNDQFRSGDTNDARVRAALRDYLERVDRGEAPDAEAFLREHAEIAGELRTVIAAEVQLRKLAAGDSTRSFKLDGQDTVVPQIDPVFSDDPAGLRVNQEFGRYRIVRLLGKGAMGAVYLAEDGQLERSVALKTPHFDKGLSRDLLDRFYREARAAGTLRHPNICPVYDVGEIDGTHYISMAYIDGHPLSAFIRAKKQQPERQILIVVRKLALALQEAHDHGIVHRDLKPANIMVDKRIEPIIMDFGLARRLEGEKTSITQNGLLIGTPAYMSPEQAGLEHAKVGPATDQFSLGVILYELLTGQLPFHGSLRDLLAQILLKDAPPPSQLRPNLDRRIDAVCARMMAKEPAQRYESLAAVAEALAVILRDPKQAAPEPGAHLDGAPPDSEAAASGPHPTFETGSAAIVRQTLPLDGSDPAALEELARKYLGQHDYAGALQLVERIPEAKRTPGLKAVSAEADARVDEVACLIGEIDQAVRANDRESVLQKTERLLELQPRHGRALELRERFAGSGPGVAALLRREFSRPWREGGWIPWSALAVGLTFLGSLAAVIVIRTGRSASVIEAGAPTPQTAGAVTPQPVTAGAVPGRPENARRESGSPDMLTAPFDGKQAARARRADALALRIPEQMTNSAGIELMLIPTGQFDMGIAENADVLAKALSADRRAMNSGRPAHRVTISRPFYLGKSEVTVGQFRMFVEATKYLTDAEKDVRGGLGLVAPGKFEPKISFNWREWGGVQTDDCPVVNVSYHDALEFCNWISTREGMKYRLPTEAEWEYACRAGSITRFYNGDDPNNLSKIANIENKVAKDRRFTSPVGRFAANNFELFDMSGNVAEWCSDWWHADYYEHSPLRDPPGPNRSRTRVIRGGSWLSPMFFCLSAHRQHGPPTHFSCSIGFRIALTAQAVTNNSAAQAVTNNSAAEAVTDKSAAPVTTKNTTAPASTDRSAAPAIADSKNANSGGPAASSPSPLDVPLPAGLTAPFDERAARAAQQDWSARLKTPAEMTDSLGVPLRLIPPGQFQMGTDNKRTADFVKPAHRVRITRAFYLGKHELTRGQFDEFARSAPFVTRAETDKGGSWPDNSEKRGKWIVGEHFTWRSPGFPQDDRHPVVDVSWNDALAFCQWLSRREGCTYRLPTEAEWEYACRAGTLSPIYGARGKGALTQIGNVADASAKAQFPAWTDCVQSSDGFVFTSPVGQFPPNNFGLYDTLGNVIEWCGDWYAPDYYKNAPESDPLGPPSGRFRIARGGSFATTTTAFSRWFFVPNHHVFDFGFRVVREIPQDNPVDKPAAVSAPPAKSAEAPQAAPPPTTVSDPTSPPTSPPTSAVVSDAASAAAAPNLLVNGSFEDGPAVVDLISFNAGSTAITGWTVTRGQIHVVGKRWMAADGQRSLDLHGSPGFGGVSQKFKTVKGQRYRVTFSLAGAHGALFPLKRLAATVADAKAEFVANSTGAKPANMGWTTKSFEFVAVADESTLEIYTLETREPFRGPSLDNVRVVAVPNTD